MKKISSVMKEIVLSGLCSLDSVPGTEYLLSYEINYLILKSCNSESHFPGLNQRCKCFCHKVLVSKGSMRSIYGSTSCCDVHKEEIDYKHLLKINPADIELLGF